MAVAVLRGFIDFLPVRSARRLLFSRSLSSFSSRFFPFSSVSSSFPCPFLFNYLGYKVYLIPSNVRPSFILYVRLIWWWRRRSVLLFARLNQPVVVDSLCYYKPGTDPTTTILRCLWQIWAYYQSKLLRRLNYTVPLALSSTAGVLLFNWTTLMLIWWRISIFCCEPTRHSNNSIFWSLLSGS